MPVEPPIDDDGVPSATPSATPPPPAVVVVPPRAPTPVQPSARRCENCGAPLYGDHCYACGQPVKGLVRQFSSIAGDFLDTVFNIDSRVLRTIGPLLAMPGYLSLEYFAGRRVRYVTPMRLFLFLSLVAFFAIQASINIEEDTGERDTAPLEVKVGDNAIENAKTVQEVEKLAADATAKLDAARKEVAGVPGAGVGMQVAQEQIKEQAKRQVEWLRDVERAKRLGKPEPERPGHKDRNLNFDWNDRKWDPKTNPIDFAWLPAPATAALNRRMAHARDVLNRSNSEKPFVDALFNVLPQTLIVLMPLFALMLKVAYWFKRRLYMEHLIVALHSHSFISLALLVVLGFKWLQDWLAPGGGALNALLGWGIALTSLWIPLYLLLMQKRVYGQGWIMTLLKFFVLGICYSVLLSFGLLGAMLVGLLTL
jgi:hypothetical protein